MAETTSPPRIFTVDEALPILRVKKTKLYKLVKERRVPYRRIGDRGAVGFTREDLDQIIADSLVPAVKR